MKKIAIILMIIPFVLISCNKTAKQKKVMYMVTNSQAGFNASYLRADGTLFTEYRSTGSANDKVTLNSYLANQGDIVYISVLDTTKTSFVKVFVYIDGKVYKQASRTDNTTMPVTVSGTIPYDN